MKDATGIVLSSTLLLLVLAQSDLSHLRKVGVQRVREGEIIWEGRSSRFFIRWMPSNITVTPSNDPTQDVFSARSLARKGLKEYIAILGGDPTEPETGFGDCSYNRRFRVLSVVGSVVSFQDAEFSSCEKEAHPEAYTRFTAVDFLRAGGVSYVPGELNVSLAKPGKVAKLTDYFSESEITTALLSDSLVKNALRYKKTSRLPKTLAELIRVFNEEELSIKTKDGCTFEISEDILTRFAFHHLESNKVAIRLGLSPNVGACRTMHAELGILLPIPESLKSPLALAQSRKEGLLMNDEERMFGERETLFIFKVKPSEYLHKRHS